jgi:hypothetical protein
MPVGMARGHALSADPFDCVLMILHSIFLGGGFENCHRNERILLDTIIFFDLEIDTKFTIIVRLLALWDAPVKTNGIFIIA